MDQFQSNLKKNIVGCGRVDNQNQYTPENG